MKFLATLGLIFSLSSFANTKVSVAWDCAIEDNLLIDLESRVSCIDLKLAYFKNPNVTEAAASNSDLDLTLRSIEGNNIVEYIFTTKWMDQEPYTWPPLELNNTLSSGELTEKITSFLETVTKTYVQIRNNGQVEDRPSKESPFYVAPSISGNIGSQQGSQSLNGGGHVYGNYSSPKWRVMGDVYGGFRNDVIKTTAINTGSDSKISYSGAYAGAVRDLRQVGKGRWDIAIFVSDKTVNNDLEIDSDEVDLPESALKNKARRSSITAGTEWIAVPFLTETSNGNISVRYSLGVEHHNYISPENFEAMKETFAKHTLQVYLARYFTKVDLKVSASAFTSSFRELPMQGVSGSTEVRYKVNPRLTIGANASLVYAKNRVMSPTEGTMSFMGLTSGTTPLTYNGSLSVTYTLGNIRIFNREQRWKD